MEEPQPKRIKLANVKAITFKAILSEELTRLPSLVAVCVSTLPSITFITQVMKELQQYLPLRELYHLKRVHQAQVVLCLAEDLPDIEKVKDFLINAKFSPENVDILSKKVELKYVAAKAPKIRWQYDEMQKYWPCKQRFDKYKDSLYTNTCFTPEQKKFHQMMVKLILKLEENDEGTPPMGICVDPRSNRIVAIASSYAQENPICHCPMILIDNVARTQIGGAFKQLLNDDDFVESSGAPTSPTGTTLSGIPKKFYDAITEDYDFPDVAFGAEKQILPKAIEAPFDKKAKPERRSNLKKFGPYICTGYDVYLSHEPCLMCAMALVHSRVKRLFFLRTSKNGALATNIRLQFNKELNHRYEVFQVNTHTQDNNDDDDDKVKGY